MSKTTLTNNSNLNKAHDTYIRTYKQAATTNKPDTTKGRKLNEQINKDNNNSNYKRLVIKHSKII